MATPGLLFFRTQKDFGVAQPRAKLFPEPSVNRRARPTIGAALASRYYFLWVYCPACRTMRDIDLRTLDRHRDTPVTGLIPSLSCRSCRPNAPFAELTRLSRTSIADEMRIEHTRRVLGE